MGLFGLIAQKMDQSAMNDTIHPKVRTLWNQLVYAYEHGEGHSGHVSNACHTATAITHLINDTALDNEKLRECNAFYMEDKQLLERTVAELKERLEVQDRWLQNGVYFTNEEFSEHMAEVNSVRRDAKYYQWIRNPFSRVETIFGADGRLKGGLDLDLAIDAAMADLRGKS